MKYLAFVFVAFFAFAMIASAEDGPTNLSHNNIENFVNVDIDASAVLSANVEQNIIALLLAAVNQQAAVIGADPHDS